VVAASSATAGWTCAVEEWSAGCTTVTPMAPGAQAEIELVLEGSFPAGQPRPGIRVVGDLTPETTQDDNQRFADVL
jgi:hypothetical protein